ncbi:MAG TPA: hypothetical protein VKE96_29230 [Vicinamibacterales bacterium]|nr:hypothetical protein [Vicinamibacterales bacterium]
MLLRLVLAVLTLFALQAALVALISAVRRRGSVYVTIVIVAFASAPLAVFADRLLFGRPLQPDGRLFLALTHLALGGFLFHFMTLPDRSVTLRILVELLLAPDRALSLGDLTARYGVRTMIGSRLAQLQDGRCLTIAADGAIALLPRGRSFGRAVTAGRRMFRITSAN